MQPASETSWLATVRILALWPSRPATIPALVGGLLELEDHDVRTPILGTAREVSRSRCIRLFVIATTNLHDLQCPLLLTLLDQVNRVGKSVDE